MDSFSNILFVNESVSGNKAAFAQAVTLAKNNQAKLTVLGVVNLPAMPTPTMYRPQEELHDAILAAQWNELRELCAGEDDTPHCDLKVAAGREFLEVIREVLVENRDLVIKAIGRPDGPHALFGSTDMKLLRQCPCPLWLIKSTKIKGERQILAAVDHDPQQDALNHRILGIATSLALSEFAELHVVHAWRLAYEKSLRSGRAGYVSETVDSILTDLEDSRKRWLEALIDEHYKASSKVVRNYLKPRAHLIKGRADRIVPRLCKKLGAELIVMGTVGRVGVPGLFIGNTAEAILRQIDCSVLAVKPEGFVSPVSIRP